MFYIHKIYEYIHINIFTHIYVYIKLEAKPCGKKETKGRGVGKGEKENAWPDPGMCLQANVFNTSYYV